MLRCLSNQFRAFDSLEIEYCGSQGYCFLFVSLPTAVNGCDHNFLCELLDDQKAINQSQSESYHCAEDLIQFRNKHGIFCCCRDDLCNYHEATEYIKTIGK